jgi:hypothetical protein
MALLVHASSALHIPTATEDGPRRRLVSADPDQFFRNEAVMPHKVSVLVLCYCNAAYLDGHDVCY